MCAASGVGWLAGIVSVRSPGAHRSSCGRSSSTREWRAVVADRLRQHHQVGRDAGGIEGEEIRSELIGRWSWSTSVTPAWRVKAVVGLDNRWPVVQVRNAENPAVCGAFCHAPKRTRTSTRLSRTRSSTLPVKRSRGPEPCCSAISRPAVGRFGPYLTHRRVSRRVSRNRQVAGRVATARGGRCGSDGRRSTTTSGAAPCNSATGLRQTELLGLRWRDVDMRAQRVRIATPESAASTRARACRISAPAIGRRDRSLGR